MKNKLKDIFLYDKSVIELDCGDDCTTINLLNVIESYTHKRFLWFVNYTPTKLLKHTCKNIHPKSIFLPFYF